MSTYRRVAQLRTAAQLRDHLDSLGVDLAFDESVESGADAPLAQPYEVQGRSVGNRFSILPMEGWDGTPDGQPSDLTRRRWRNFGLSGAKLIWGCEAVAVRHDGRANPNQLMISEALWPGLAQMRQEMLATHQAAHGRTDDLLVGLQLTHSGRFSRPGPGWDLKPHILYSHPYLQDKYHLPDDFPIITDDFISHLVDDFIRAAVWAQRAGFDFVDIKHCHGYLGHEFLSAVDRDGRYGGSFENRTRFLREIVEGIRAEAPGLQIGVRLSAFDWQPFKPNEEGIGEPMGLNGKPYPYAFGGDETGLAWDLTEPCAFLDLLHSLGIELVCLTAGSPYYNPHIQRPALFPPSDGYQPPEDPLLGVARQIEATARLKQLRPAMTYVGSGYSYLQEWLPNVAQSVVRSGGADFIGVGRMVLSYPAFAADVLAGRALSRKHICRTFSDCTTAPRNGLLSGCYPLDDFYKQLPEAEAVARAKQEMKL